MRRRVAVWAIVVGAAAVLPPQRCPRVRSANVRHRGREAVGLVSEQPPASGREPDRPRDGGSALGRPAFEPAAGHGRDDRAERHHARPSGKDRVRRLGLAPHRRRLELGRGHDQPGDVGSGGGFARDDPPRPRTRARHKDGRRDRHDVTDCARLRRLQDPLGTRLVAPVLVFDQIRPSNEVPRPGGLRVAIPLAPLTHTDS
jgi:hypothetical protein